MQLKIINSNSAGNAYILESSTGEALLIECGVRFDMIKKALDFNLRKVVGCLLTHEHGDHAKSITDVMKAGIKVWASEGTHLACNTVYHHRAGILKSGDRKLIGNFFVKPFDVLHDVKEPLGFLINHPECGTVLFMTDTKYCEYNFSDIKLNNIIIEANYCQTIIDKRVAEGANPQFLRDRVLQSHMSLDTCKKTLSTYDLSGVNNIVLIHLSDGNSHESRFKTEVEEHTGKLVHIARPGVTIPFNQTPF
jgi:phosphoribosyl 1,2-cyclic phosphodiesterase